MEEVEFYHNFFYEIYNNHQSEFNKYKIKALKVNDKFLEIGMIV